MIERLEAQTLKALPPILHCESSDFITCSPKLKQAAVTEVKCIHSETAQHISGITQHFKPLEKCHHKLCRSEKKCKLFSGFLEAIARTGVM